MGRPNEYTESVGQAICVKLASGLSLSKICKPNEMPNRTTVNRWRNEGELSPKDSPLYAFSIGYALARENQSDRYFDHVLEIAEKGSGDAARDRLHVDTLKWILARMDARKYGDKTETTLKGDRDAPIEVDHTVNLSPEDRAEVTQFVQGIVRGRGE